VNTGAAAPVDRRLRLRRMILPCGWRRMVGQLLARRGFAVYCAAFEPAPLAGSPHVQATLPFAWLVGF